MIKEIKKQRLLYQVDDILKNCYIEQRAGFFRLYSYMKDIHGMYHSIFKIFQNNNIELNHFFFIELGMNPDITEDELKSIINERFITSNKTQP